MLDNDSRVDIVMRRLMVYMHLKQVGYNSRLFTIIINS